MRSKLRIRANAESRAGMFSAETPLIKSQPINGLSHTRVQSSPQMNSANGNGDAPEGNLRVEVIAQLRRGRSLGDVAREYHLSVADLCGWIAETASAFERVTFTAVESEDSEIQRLRVENECLRKQRDFYRKAAGIVALDVYPVDRGRT